MKGIVCKVCGYISIDGTTPTACPVCGAKSFEEQGDAIHQPGDVTNFSESEKKHIPAITVVPTCGLIEGCKDVHVKVGEIIHPMLAEHFIMNIDFYIDKVFVARTELKPDKINPAAALHLKVTSGKLTVIERCNKHGAWISETNL
ncbi:MAG: hypothetical protein KKH94_05785 [Candidatus Omnitrophica bacterium]|nr:hypothetical protein [Candidatus Omnitrophota bacterium]